MDLRRPAEWKERESRLAVESESGSPPDQFASQGAVSDNRHLRLREPGKDVGGGVDEDVDSFLLPEHRDRGGERPPRSELRGRLVARDRLRTWGRAVPNQR